MRATPLVLLALLLAGDAVGAAAHAARHAGMAGLRRRCRRQPSSRPLADINRANVASLVDGVGVEARRDAPLEEFGTRPGNFQNTPLMIDNVLYVSTPYNRVVALDAESGRRAVGVRPARVRGRSAAERHRLRAPRPRRVARQRQAADLPQLALSADLPRRRDRQARRDLRRQAAASISAAA